MYYLNKNTDGFKCSLESLIWNQIRSVFDYQKSKNINILHDEVKYQHVWKFHFVNDILRNLMRSNGYLMKV